MCTHMCICVKSFVTCCHSPEARPGESTQMQTQTEAQIKVGQCFIYKVKQNLWMLTMNCEMRQPEKSKCEA